MASSLVNQFDVHFGKPGPLLKSPFGFQQYGESGAWVCEKYTHLAGLAALHRRSEERDTEEKQFGLKCVF